MNHGLVGAVRDWPLSSFHRDVRCGRVPEDWGGEPDEGESGDEPAIRAKPSGGPNAGVAICLSGCACPAPWFYPFSPEFDV